jgi:hypothetical protein
MVMGKLILKIEQISEIQSYCKMGFNVQFNYKALDFFMYTLLFRETIKGS